jgi:hypothetical protein
MKLVEINWVDSCGSPTIWEEPEPMPPLSIISIGYLLEKNDKYVTICQSVSESENVGRRFTIPAGCIKKIKVIRK